MIRIFTLTLLALVIGGCTTVDNEDSHSELKEKLTGKWYLEGIIYGDGEFEVLTECQKNTNWTFSQDDKLFIRQFYDDVQGPCVDLNPDNHSMDYSISGNAITYTVASSDIEGGFYVARYELTQISESKLQLRAIYEVDGIKAGDPGYEAAPFEGYIPFKDQWTFVFNK